MPNTRLSKECTIGASLITTSRVIGYLFCIAGLLTLLAGSKDAFAQSAVVEQLPPTVAPTVDSTEQDERIVEVRIEGNETVEISKLPQLNTRAGQIFDPQAIEEDVRTLHRTRKFIDVLPKYVRVRQGVVVVFTVVERPTLRYVKFVGNQRVTNRTLRKK